MSSSERASLDPVRDLYDQSLERHGATAPGVGWGDEQTHLLRFEKLASIIDDTNPVSVSDLGCGYGAFLGYVVQQGTRLTKFKGYDISSRMLDRAVDMYPNFEWIQGSKLGSTTDYSFACGIFNVRMDVETSVWQKHIEETLDNLHKYSLRGFAFNMLSTYVDYRAPNLYYGDPRFFFDLCKRKYSRKVALLHDYPLFEWTMLVKK